MITIKMMTTMTMLNQIAHACLLPTLIMDDILWSNSVWMHGWMSAEDNDDSIVKVTIIMMVMSMTLMVFIEMYLMD